MRARSPISRPVLPLGLQLLALLVGALVVAQLVTLALTVALPPAPSRTWNLDQVAAALRGGALPRSLERRTMPGPPDTRAPGWLVSESSRAALARRLNVAERDVVLVFYTQLPVGGVSVPVRGGPLAGARETDATDAAARALIATLIGTARAQALPGGGPPVGVPGGGFPGGGFPGGGMPGGRPPGGGMPGGGGVPGGRPPVSAPGGDQMRGGPPAAARNQPAAPSSIGERPATIRPENAGPALQFRQPIIVPPTVPIMIAPAPVQAAPTPGSRQAEPSTLTPATDAAPPTAPSSATSLPASGGVAIAPLATPISAAAARPRAAVTERLPAFVPIPFRRPSGLLSFATPPFIEGDFIAAIRRSNGTWLAVAPRAEPFPNRWQTRVMLWFALSLLIVAPLAWLFARRIVHPLERFAEAAEVLGRDPSASVMPLSGPAEVGRAARAFNLMKGRLRAFVDDRTAMVGAISHDLRTPLTRLRFRLENVPDDQRDALLREVEEMEAMISQVIAYIRDASTPGRRERLDLAELVESSVEDARMVGGSVRWEAGTSLPVEVDAMGIRRLLGNLLENALKYGDDVRVRIGSEGGCALAEVIDDGPGIPADERERAFEPFFRGERAHGSGKPGSGLGLAVCRSIARAHGGEVRLEQRDEGFVAQLSLPLSYGGTLRRAA